MLEYPKEVMKTSELVSILMISTAMALHLAIIRDIRGNIHIDMRMG